MQMSVEDEVIFLFNFSIDVRALCVTIITMIRSKRNVLECVRQERSQSPADVWATPVSSSIATILAFYKAIEASLRCLNCNKLTGAAVVKK